jgi:hypothetical protein
MAQINKNLPNFKMPASMGRAEAGPLDLTSVYYSYSDAFNYATDPEGVAYVGQILSVVDETNKTVTVYKIADDAGTLVEIGSDIENAGGGTTAWLQTATIDLASSLTTADVSSYSGEIRLQGFDMEELFTAGLTGADLGMLLRKGRVTCINGLIKYVKNSINSLFIITNIVYSAGSVQFVGTHYTYTADGSLSLANNGNSINIINSDVYLNSEKILTYKNKTSYKPGAPILPIINVDASTDGNPVAVDISEYCESTPDPETGTNKLVLTENLIINVPANTEANLGNTLIDLNGKTLTIIGADYTSSVSPLVIDDTSETGGKLKLENIIFDGGKY